MKKGKDRYVFCDFPDDGVNFWDANPELQYLTPYAEFKKKEGKRRSSRIMCAIWLIHDPKAKANQSGSRDLKEIVKDISTNYLNDKNFPWEDYRKIVEAYRQDCRTKAEKELDYWRTELEGRRVYQRSLPWDTERKTKDEMLSTQKKLFDDFLSVLKEVEKERKESTYHAGTRKSILEKQSKR